MGVRSWWSVGLLLLPSVASAQQLDIAGIPVRIGEKIEVVLTRLPPAMKQEYENSTNAYRISQDGTELGKIFVRAGRVEQIWKRFIARSLDDNGLRAAPDMIATAYDEFASLTDTKRCSVDSRRDNTSVINNQTTELVIFCGRYGLSVHLGYGYSGGGRRGLGYFATLFAMGVGQ